MSIIYNDYLKDLESAQSSVEFISKWDILRSINPAELEPISSTEAFTLITGLKENYTALKIDQNIIRGSIILYSVGRFESFIKELIEDMCKRFVAKAGTFEKLPKNLKQNLIIYTGIVIQNPRKYGHADGGVRSFISTMSNNLNNISPLEKINTECITITEANMRPDTINDLFSRIGADKPFEKLSTQALILSYFGTADVNISFSNLKTKLNILIDLRNSIAHPAPSITWPSKEEIIEFITFLILIGKGFDDISQIYVSSL